MVREASVVRSLIFLFWLSNLSKNSVTSLLVLGKPAVIFLPCGHTRFRTTFYAKGKCYCYYESYMNHSGIKLLCTDLKTMFQILLPRVNKMYNATSSYLMSSLKTVSLVFFLVHALGNLCPPKILGQDCIWRKSPSLWRSAATNSRGSLKPACYRRSVWVSLCGLCNKIVIATKPTYQMYTTSVAIVFRLVNVAFIYIYIVIAV